MPRLAPFSPAPWSMTTPLHSSNGQCLEPCPRLTCAAVKPPFKVACVPGLLALARVVDCLKTSPSLTPERLASVSLRLLPLWIFTVLAALTAASVHVVRPDHVLVNSHG